MIRWKLPGWARRQPRGTGRSAPPAARVVAFWSPTATGKTTLAMAAAAALAGKGKKVALLDFDTFTPDLPHAGYSLDDMAREVLRGEFDPRQSAGKIPRVQPPGVFLLSGAEDPVGVEGIGRESFAALLTALGTAFDMVVVDTNRSLALEATLAALDASDLVVMPVSGREQDARHAARYLALLREGMCFDMGKVLVVLNHPPGAESLGREALTEVLGRPVAAEVPYRREWDGLAVGDWPGPAVELVPILLGEGRQVPLAANWEQPVSGLKEVCVHERG